MTEIPVYRTGDAVSYLGHAAVVIHGNEPLSGESDPGQTVNIRLWEIVPGLSQQQDVYATSLLSLQDGQRRQARDRRALQLSRMSKSALTSLYLAGVRTPDGRVTRSLNTRDDLQRWRKDEIVNSILSIEFQEPES